MKRSHSRKTASATNLCCLPRAAVAVVVLACLVGCAGPLKQIGSEVSLVSRAPGFELSGLQGEKVGILHAVVGFGFEGYSLQVSRSLARAVKQELPRFDFIPPHEAMSVINLHGLARPYATMVMGYGQSGILERDTLQQIGRSLDANYVLLPGMAAFQQSITGRFSFFGFRLFQTRISVLRLTAQLWDTRNGRIVWESSGEATLAAEDVREFRIPFEEIAERLWAILLTDLRTPPAPLPPPHSQE